MRCLTVMSALTLLLLGSGCSCVRDDLNPSRPANVRGWKSIREGGVTLTAAFLLKPGELAENDKFGIELIKIIPPEKCSGYLAEPKPVEVVIRFYRVPNKETLLQRSFTGIGHTLFYNDPIRDSPYNIVGISIAYVNTKEGGVYFNLIGRTA